MLAWTVVMSMACLCPPLPLTAAASGVLRGMRSLPVRKARLSSSVRFVSTKRGGRTLRSASRTAARTAPGPDASERRRRRRKSTSQESSHPTPEHLNTASPEHSITWTPDHSITWPQHHLSTASPDATNKSCDSKWSAVEILIKFGFKLSINLTRVQ